MTTCSTLISPNPDGNLYPKPIKKNHLPNDKPFPAASKHVTIEQDAGPYLIADIPYHARVEHLMRVLRHGSRLYEKKHELNWAGMEPNSIPDSNPRPQIKLSRGKGRVGIFCPSNPGSMQCFSGP